MKRVFLIIVILLVLGAAPQTSRPMPADHPPVMPPLPKGHPEIAQEVQGEAQLPNANPEDVQSLKSIIAAYYDSISGPKGQPRDWNRFRSLFIPQAQFITARPTAEASLLLVLTPEDFILANNTYFERGGYFETEIGHKATTFGNIAHVLSTYESRRAREESQPYSRGINSIQLINDGTRWYIASVMWDHEREGNALPTN